jgi:hypothetical protein
MLGSSKACLRSHGLWRPFIVVTGVCSGIVQREVDSRAQGDQCTDGNRLAPISKPYGPIPFALSPPVLGAVHAPWSLSDKKCVIWRAGMAREKTLWLCGYAYKVCPSALRQGRWLAQADEKPPGNQVKRRREFVRFSAFEANSRQTLFPFIGYVVDRSNVSDYLSPAYIDF